MNLKFIALLLVSIAANLCVFSQSTIVPTTGKLQGTNGSANYTLGQVICGTCIGATGKTIQGIQQPYKLDTVTQLNDTYADIQCTLYPNPTAGIVNIKAETSSYDELRYKLINMNGQVLLQGFINLNNTQLNMSHLKAATYIVNIIENNQVIKTYKITKR